MKIAELTDAQARVLLPPDAGVPCARLSGEDVKDLNIIGKYGWPVSALAADAAGREHAVLAINLAADGDEAPLSAELVKLAGDRLSSAATALAEYIRAETVLVAAPAGVDLPLKGAETLRVEANPVLRELSAFYHILETGELRSAPLDPCFPSQGYRGQPTVPVDGETLLKMYAMTQPGYEDTKLLALRSGGLTQLAEVRVGTGLAALFAELRMEPKKPLLLGGVTGRFLPSAAAEGTAVAWEDHFDSVAVYGDKDCLADACARLLRRAREQSCQKCVLCREGTWHLAGIFEGITAGKGKKDDLEMALDIGPLIRAGAFCSFGRRMADAAVTAVECCRSELEAHITRKQCPAGVCAAFNRKVYCVDPKSCTGCGACVDACDEMAIEGKKKFIHMIDPDMCTGCGNCVEACEEGAIVVSDGSIKLPKKLTKVGKF